MKFYSISLIFLSLGAFAFGAEHAEHQSSSLAHPPHHELPPVSSKIESQTTPPPDLSVEGVDTVTSVPGPDFLPLMKRDGCMAGLVGCAGRDSCCPAGTYCTTDPIGRAACCPEGAACTGIVGSDESVTFLLPTASGGLLGDPVSGTASSRRIPTWLGLFSRLMRIGSVRAVSKKEETEDGDNQNDSASDTAQDTPGDGLDMKFSGPMLYENSGGKAKNCTGNCDNATSAAMIIRPFNLFGVPFYLAGQVMAAISPAQNDTSAPRPELKFVGANNANQYGAHGAHGVHGVHGGGLTSYATSKPRPLRIFSTSVSVAKSIKAAAGFAAHKERAHDSSF